MSWPDYRGPLRTTEARAAKRGEVSLQLTGWEVLSLAVNVVQNGWDYAELPLESRRHDDLKRLGLPGAVRAVWRDEVLRQVHREILRANLEGLELGQVAVSAELVASRTERVDDGTAER